jgi:hypothetical protein
MIAPETVKEKALKIWQSGRVLSAWLANESLFPLDIPFRKVSAGEALERFNEVRAWVNRLREGSRERKGFGYSLDFTEVNHRQLGTQQFPSRIWFETVEDFLRFIGRGKDFDGFRQLAGQTLAEQPEQSCWLERKPLKLLEHREAWPRVLAVCRFLRDNPMPGCYIRELDIPGVDSKFIEQHKSLLRELLDIILPPEAIRSEVTALSGHGFERRYGFRYDEALIRFRILDPDVAWQCGVSDVSVPSGQFPVLDIPCDTVFITENKINGLTFPPVPKAIVVFGLGYGISALRNVEWFGTKQIYYWGDIDTHGFSILSQLRGYYPWTRSFLMDRETLMEFRHLWGREDNDKRCRADLPNLSESERELYLELRGNVLGKNVRLEQERIAFGRLRQSLEAIMGGGAQVSIGA